MTLNIVYIKFRDIFFLAILQYILFPLLLIRNKYPGKKNSVSNNKERRKKIKRRRGKKRIKGKEKKLRWHISRKIGIW